MKIVVRGSDTDSWWELVSDSGKQIATSSRTYGRRSDAKKSAVRFTKELGDSYYYEPFNGINIEVEEPR